MNQFERLTVRQISDWLGLSESETWSFARNLPNSFWPSREITVNGKSRVIDAPKPNAKKRLRRLHRAIQKSKLLHGAAHGGVRRKSIFTSARKHTAAPFIWTRDAKDCFPSVDDIEMRGELLLLGFDPLVAKLLTMLFVVHARIPQGSPLSNDALNLFFYRLDQFAASHAGKIGFGFSRVADDFVLSGYQKKLGDHLIRMIEERLSAHGLEINDKKRREHGLQTAADCQTVHNLIVNNPGSVQVNRVHRKSAMELADRYVELAKRVDAFSLPAVADVRERLRGYYYFLRQANHSPVKHIKIHLDRGDRLVQKKLAAAKLTSPKGKWWVVVRKGKNPKNEPMRLAAIWKKRLTSIA